MGKGPEHDLKEFPTCHMVGTTKGYIKETREQGGRRQTRRKPYAKSEEGRKIPHYQMEQKVQDTDNEPKMMEH